MADLIGTGRCPIGCGSHKARYTLSAKGLAVGTCNTCNCQVFARSDRSDELLRANIIPDKAEPSPAPAPGPAPAPSPAADAAPATPAKRVFGWGILTGKEF